MVAVWLLGKNTFNFIFHETSGRFLQHLPTDHEQLCSHIIRFNLNIQIQHKGLNISKTYIANIYPSVYLRASQP